MSQDWSKYTGGKGGQSMDFQQYMDFKCLAPRARVGSNGAVVADDLTVMSLHFRYLPCILY